VLWKDENQETVSTICNPSRSRQLTFRSLQTKDREAVVISLPVSMHAGQIFLLTKLLTAIDLRFYDFESGAPVERWRYGPSASS
jgi:hypothetical protein